MFSKEVIALARPFYEALKKLGWNEYLDGLDVGSPIVYKNKLGIIIEGSGSYEFAVKIDEGDHWRGTYLLLKKDFIPLLPWERVRKILKQFGYSFSITSGASGGQITVYKNVGTDKVYEKYHNNDLQREVMVAVIEFAKEPNDVKS